MKTATIKTISEELHARNPQELLELCLRLSKFKKENKELLTYLLFESSDESGYVASVKAEIDEQFEQINRKSPYFFKKSIRKILTFTKRNIRYSQSKNTEIELLVYFCEKLKKLNPSIKRNTALLNLFNRQIDEIVKKVSMLHEDLQFDYQDIIMELKK